jgi:NADPH:quinone reductase
MRLVDSGAVRPVIGRRISMREVAGALNQHEPHRSSGRTVVDVARG